MAICSGVAKRGDIGAYTSSLLEIFQSIIILLHVYAVSCASYFFVIFSIIFLVWLIAALKRHKYEQ